MPSHGSSDTEPTDPKSKDSEVLLMPIDTSTMTDSSVERRPDNGIRGKVSQIKATRSLRWFELLAAPIVFAIILGPVYGAWLGSDFLSASSRVFDLNANAEILVIALGVLFCLVSGHFDLSAVALSGLVAILTIGLRVRQELPFPLVLVIALAVGLVGGFVNGVLVGRFNLNSFIATLPTSGIFTGIATAYSGGSSLLAAQGRHPVPTWFTGPTSFSSFSHKAPEVAIYVLAVLVVLAGVSVVRERIPAARYSMRIAATLCFVIVVALCAWALRGNASWPVLILIALTLITWAIMRYTVFGRSAMATGSNPSAARLAGIRVERTIITSYTLSGLFAAIAGIMTAATLGSADPGVTDSYLLPAYAAVFLSTVLFTEGRFHPWGTVIGGFAVVEISQGLVTGGVAFKWTEFFNGTALLIAVSISTLIRRRPSH
jgi:ribose/xylose/arabinose/galactoside ABC-type transport system permease subunit